MALENHHIFNRFHQGSSKGGPRFHQRRSWASLRFNWKVPTRFRTEVFLAPFLPLFPPKFGSTGGFPPNIMFVHLKSQFPQLCLEHFSKLILSGFLGRILGADPFLIPKSSVQASPITSLHFGSQFLQLFFTFCINSLSFGVLH